MKIYKKYTATIPDYPTEIKVSDKKRATYWYKGDITPKKYADSLKFGFNTEDILVDLSTGSKVVKNNKTAGNPRMLTINAQKIYVGIHHSVRSKIVNELHDLFSTHFKAQLPANIDVKDRKILIGLNFHDVYSGKLPDLDNLANLFVKTGIDCLTTANNPNQTKGTQPTHKLGIIPDDKMIFINSIVVQFTDVANVKDRKLDFNIYQVSEDFSVDDLLTKTLQDGEDTSEN